MSDLKKDEAIPDNNQENNKDTRKEQDTKRQAFKKKSSKKKPEFIDDGRSIADMNVEGFSWYMPKKFQTERQNLSDLKLTRKEKWAMIIGAFKAIIPVVFVMIALLFGLFLLMALWLS